MSKGVPLEYNCSLQGFFPVGTPAKLKMHPSGCEKGALEMAKQVKALAADLITRVQSPVLT